MSTFTTRTSNRPSRGRRAVVLAGAAGSLTLALSMSGTLSAFTATLTHGNVGNSGTVLMQETLLNDAGTATTTMCNSNDGAQNLDVNKANCSINLYGGADLRPGGASVTKVRIANTGTVDASAFTMAFGTCEATAPNRALAGTKTGTGANSACGKFNVKIDATNSEGKSGTVLARTPLAAAPTSPTSLFTGALTGPVAKSGGYYDLTITVDLDESADNTYAGLQVTQPITWTFTS